MLSKCFSCDKTKVTNIKADKQSQNKPVCKEHLANEYNKTKEGRKK
jgi:hypothetical protein